MTIQSRGGLLIPGKSPNAIRDEMVTVVCGTRDVRERLVGRTVAQIRTEFGSTLQIPSGAVAVLAGQRVAPDQEDKTIVGPGTIEYVKHTGIKG